MAMTSVYPLTTRRPGPAGGATNPGAGKAGAAWPRPLPGRHCACASVLASTLKVASELKGPAAFPKLVRRQGVFSCGQHFVMGPVPLGILLFILTACVPAWAGAPKEEDDDTERLPSKCEGI